MKKLFIIVVIFLAIPTILPLFHQGLFPVHDDTQVARVLTMGKALKDGLLPVRWVDFLGYNFGYPIFNFYAPLAYYIGGFFILFGFSALISTKIMMGLGMMLAGISMYLLASSIFSKKAGFLSAVLYLYAPYHAVDLYVRGAVGELFAYAFLPLPFWGLWGLYKTQKFRYAVVTSISLAAIIISHNLTAMMLLPFILFVMGLLSIISWRKKEYFTVYLFIISLAIGFLLSSFYTIPAIFELQYTNVLSILGGGSNPVDHFVCPIQLWQGIWGYGGSIPGCLDGMSFMLGKIHILFVLIGFITLGYLFFKKRYQRFFILLNCFILLIVSLFMMQDISRPIWESIPLLSYVQFPWRYLSLAALGTSLIAGGVIAAFNQEKSRISLLLVILTVFATIFYYGKYFKPQYYKEDIAKYSATSQIIWNISKISDEYMPQNFLTPKSYQKVPKVLVEAVTGDISIQALDEKTEVKKVSLYSSGGKTRLNIAYFPAWQIKVDDNLIKPQITNGFYEFPLSGGQHIIQATFKETPLEVISNILTLIGFSLLIIGIIKTSKIKLL